MLDQFGMNLQNPPAIFGGKTKEQDFDRSKGRQRPLLMKTAATKSGGHATDPAIALWKNEVLWPSQ